MHILYTLINTETYEQYVGIAVCVDRSGEETLAARFSRHIGRAYNQDKDWALCESIRKHGHEVFVPLIIDFIRGKTAAHHAENLLRRTGEYALNTA